jgi:aconitate hydratase
MCPEYGATAAMFYIDQQTMDYLRLTGREPAGASWSSLRQGRRPVGRRAEDRAVRTRAAVRPVQRGAQHGRPVQPAPRLPTSDLAERGIADGQAGNGALPRKRRA